LQEVIPGSSYPSQPITLKIPLTKYVEHTLQEVIPGSSYPSQPITLKTSHATKMT
jgi:hypothetical protein